ncbi:rhamnulokinase family protein [Bacillus sp. FJAT-50079]|uniref:rhamnulokinase n=1 Tax=Bacillus sp. FJAT-50079 TaxID=2833577 RepID=UPI001BCA1558|nr:rhamnulokinase [Bacillus sp. FJAT-50079]
MNNYIAVDIGASSGRLVLGRIVDGKIRLTEVYRFKNEIIKKDKGYFWNIEGLFLEIIEGLKIAKKRGITQTMLGIDTWGVDYVLLNESGDRVQEVYCYRDPRTNQALEAIEEYMPLEVIYQKTGISYYSYNTLAQLFMHDSNELEKTSNILFIPDYLYYRLTGRYTNASSTASTSQILNVSTKDYDSDIVDLLGLQRDQFPDLINPGVNLGGIKDELTIKYDLPACQLVSVPSHDTASAVVGVPAFQEEISWAFLSSGTWSILGVENSEPINSERAFQESYTNELGAFNTYRVSTNMTGMWIIQEIHRMYGEQYSFAELVEEAQKVKPFRFIINCSDTRFLKPENMVEEIRLYCRATGQERPETVGEVVRCAIDSLALTYKKALAKLEGVIERKIDVLHIVGGGVNNKLLCRLTANVCGVNVIAGPTESSALGNIVSQMITSGEILNLKEGRQLISRSMNITEYEPEEIDRIDEIYMKFNSIVNAAPSAVQFNF